MNGVAFPEGYRLAPLERGHPRRRFDCGNPGVTDGLRTKALQGQLKRLSATKVLLDQQGAIAGYYTLATGQADFSDLPAELARKLPRRALPVAVLAWLGVNRTHQKQGLDRLLLARVLRDCYDAGRTFALDDARRETIRSFEINYGNSFSHRIPRGVDRAAGVGAAAVRGQDVNERRLRAEFGPRSCRKTRLAENARRRAK